MKNWRERDGERALMRCNYRIRTSKSPTRITLSMSKHLTCNVSSSKLQSNTRIKSQNVELYARSNLISIKCIGTAFSSSMKRRWESGKHTQTKTWTALTHRWQKPFNFISPLRKQLPKRLSVFKSIILNCKGRHCITHFLFLLLPSCFFSRILCLASGPKWLGSINKWNNTLTFCRKKFFFFCSFAVHSYGILGNV